MGSFDIKFYSIKFYILDHDFSGTAGSAKKPLGGTIKSVSEEVEEELRRKQRLAERQARQAKNENTAHLVERIALDLDQLDINEAVEMAANAVVSNNQSEDQCHQFKNDHEDGGGYQKVPSNEQCDDENTSDEDSAGFPNQGEELEHNNRVSQSQIGLQRMSEGKHLENENMSVVQALASGVEVAASDGGKVRKNSNIVLKYTILNIFDFR